MAAIAPMADPVFSPIDEACEVFSKSYQHIRTIIKRRGAFNCLTAWVSLSKMSSMIAPGESRFESES